MKVWITGSSGMVGGNLVEAFRASGHEVVVSRSSETDLRDYAAAVSFMRAAKPDLVVHAAGKVGGIAANVSDPYGFFVDNVLMGVNVVRAAAEAGVPRLLNLSSSCSYPCALERPLREEDVFAGRLEPTNEGYAIAKAAVTRLCEFATRRFPSFIAKTLVPCNLYGCGDKFGEGVAHMIPAAIRKLHEAKMRGERTVTIWGDGTARREFMYAGDLAEIVEQCARRFDEIPQTMNVGVGTDLTVDEYYAAVARTVGYDGEFEHDLSKPAGMRRKLLDVSVQRSLGLMPRRTLDEGLRETYEWYVATR